VSGTILSINVSTKKGEAKKPVPEAAMRADHGIEGDVHAGPGLKQISLLAWESVEEQLELMRRKGVRCPKSVELATAAGGDRPAGDGEYVLSPGDYAENLTVRGVDLRSVSPGDAIRIGGTVRLEVTRIGKECHQHCAVFERLGDCVMPSEGVFARVVEGGRVAPGDDVTVEQDG
jgi:MOSC domain-containing protein YiiM